MSIAPCGCENGASEQIQILSEANLDSTGQRLAFTWGPSALWGSTNINSLCYLSRMIAMKQEAVDGFLSQNNRSRCHEEANVCSRCSVVYLMLCLNTAK